MKYKEMTTEQQDAFRQLFTDIVGIKYSDELRYTQYFFRIFVLANSAGILLLSTFMGALAGTGKDYSVLLSPLTKFIFGLILGAAVLVPLILDANKATNYYVEKTTKFFLNTLDVEEIKGYRLSRGSQAVIKSIYLISAILFFWGVYECMSILKQLHA